MNEHMDVIKNKRRLHQPLEVEDDTQRGGNMCREMAEVLPELMEA